MLSLALAASALAATASAAKNPKRGLCFADSSHTSDITAANGTDSVLSWVYDWGTTPPDYGALAGSWRALHPLYCIRASWMDVRAPRTSTAGVGGPSDRWPAAKLDLAGSGWRQTRARYRWARRLVDHSQA